MTALEFAILVRDKASATIDKIGREFSSTAAKANGLKGSVSSLTGVFGGLKNVLGVLGIGFGFYKVVEMMRTGVEKAHEMHLANAQIEAGLKSTNYAAGVTMETLEKGANKIKSASLYGGVELKNMQSIMLTFPKIGAKIFDPASQSIADMSTRMKMDLSHAAVMVGKALQDPVTGVMMMRRIGVNFTREQVAGFKQLVAAGKLQEAQLLILKELNTEFGGSAKAAFDATPLARYNKLVSALQIKLGNFAIGIQKILAPVLEGMVGLYHGVTKVAKWFYNLLKEGNPYALGFLLIIGLITTAMILYYTWIGIVSVATKLWAGAQAILNMAFWTNPLTWIIAGIIALIAIIWIVSQMTTGWGKTWDNTVKWMKLGIQLFAESIKLTWLVIKDQFESGFETIERGWYKLQSLWDKNSANAGLAKLSNQRDARAKEIAESSGNVEKIAKEMATMKVWEVKGNGKTFKSMFSNLKKKLGLDNFGGNNAGVDGSEDAKGGKQTAQAVASGGTRNTSIYITVGKMVESLIYQGGVGETAPDVERKIEEILMRVLFAAESAS